MNSFDCDIIYEDELFIIYLFNLLSTIYCQWTRLLDHCTCNIRLCAQHAYASLNKYVMMKMYCNR